MFSIDIPSKAKAGGKLSITVTPKTSAFTCALFKNPVKGTKTITGTVRGTRDITSWSGDLIQVEQENSSQEIKTGSKNDGVITLELVQRNRKTGKIEPIPSGRYLVKAWAGDDSGSNIGSLSKSVLIDIE